MLIGRLKDLIVIEQRVETSRDTLNNPVYEWQKFCQAYTFAEPRRGRESYDEESEQRYDETYWRFLCRMDNVSGIDSSMRIVYNGLNYEIRNIMPYPMKREMTVIEATVQDGESP